MCLASQPSLNGLIVANKSYAKGFNDAIDQCLSIICPNPLHDNEEDHERECSEVAAEVAKLRLGA